MLRNIFLFSLVLLTMLSCLDDSDCTVESRDIVNIDFKKKSPIEADTLLLEKVVLEGTDSVFYPSQERTEISVPLNSGSSSLPIIITLQDGTELSVTIEYQVVPRLISEECGVELIIEQLTVGDNDFDSVAIVNPLLEEEITTNIELYR